MSERNSDTINSRPIHRIFIPAAIVLLWCPWTLAVNHSEAGDSGQYIYAVRTTDVHQLFHANHILYASFNWLVYQLATLTGFDVDVTLSMQLVNVVASAVTASLIFILARRLGVNDALGLACSLMPLATFGYWWHSVEVECYILPLPFVLLTVLGLMNIGDGQRSLGQFVRLGGAASMATLFHQENVFLVPIVVICLLAMSRKTRYQLTSAVATKGVLVLLLTCALIIGSVYITAGIGVHGASDIVELFAWSKGRSPEGLFSRCSIMTPVKSVIGATRTLCGFHFLYGYDTAVALARRIKPDAFMDDNVLLGRSVKPSVRYLCTLTSVTAMVGLGTLIILLVKQPRNLAWSAETTLRRSTFRMFAAVAVWPYLAFVVLFDPNLIDFWIVFLPFVSLLIGMRMERIRVRWRYAPCCVFAITLFTTNLLGSVLPLNHRGGDYWYQVNEFLITRTHPEDLIITHGGWLSDHSIRSNAQATVVVSGRTPVDQLRQMIRQHDSGEIYISSWALDPESVAPTLRGGNVEHSQPTADYLKSIIPKCTVAAKNDAQTVWRLQREKDEPKGLE